MRTCAALFRKVGVSKRGDRKREGDRLPRGAAKIGDELQMRWGVGGQNEKQQQQTAADGGGGRCVPQLLTE